MMEIDVNRRLHAALRQFVVLVAWALLGGLLASSAGAQEVRRKIVLASTFPSPGSVTGTWTALTLREAFRRMGYDYENMVVPAKRAELMALQGDVDGETLRQSTYGDTRPTLLRAGVAHQWDSFSAYALRDIQLADGWDSLKDTSLRVDYRLGATHPEKQLTGRVADSQLQTVKDFPSGLRKLVVKHTDVFVDLENLVQPALAQPEFRNSGIRKIATMERLDGYCYLHEKNRALLAPLTATLTTMRKDGTIESLRKQAERAELGTP